MKAGKGNLLPFKMKLWNLILCETAFSFFLKPPFKYANTERCSHAQLVEINVFC